MARVAAVTFDAVIAHGDSDHASASAEQDVAQAGIDGVLEKHGLAMRGQHALQQIEGLLATAGDQDVVVRGSDAAGTSLIQQITAQRRVARGGAELKDLRGGVRIENLPAGGAKFVQRK